MDKRATNLLIILAVALICACLPFCLGVIGIVNAFVGEYLIDLNRNSIWYGLGGICLSMLGVVVAGVVAIILLRKEAEPVIHPDEPIPPVS